MDALEGFANRLLAGQPAIGFSAGDNLHLAALAVWVAGLYGYTYEGPMFPDNRRRFVGQIRFARNDDPFARRSAAWMRDPASDVTLPPPTHWHMNGGIGFHPPGWHPAARAFPAPDAQVALVEMEARLHRDFGRTPRQDKRSETVQPRPSGPLPAPPPDRTL